MTSALLREVAPPSMNIDLAGFTRERTSAPDLDGVHRRPDAIS
jgi:hypothetical protein